MRILIDLQGAQTTSKFRGIGRYSLSFTRGIIKNKKQHEVFVLLNGLIPESIPSIYEYLSDVLPRSFFLVWYAPGPVMDVLGNNEIRREAAEFIRETYIKQIKPDILHITSLFEGYGDHAVTSIKSYDKNTLVSVSFYDLIPFLNPKQYLDTSPIYSNHYFRKLDSLKKADLLLSISEFSRSEALENLELPEEKIVNVSTAVADTFFDDSLNNLEKCKQVLHKFKIDKPFILYTGGIDPRKNLKRLLIAYSELDENLKKENQLVLAGIIDLDELPALKNSIKKLNIHNVVFTDFITDLELKILYKECKLFVFPSWHEGFGLPVLEAMHCGAAVICSSTSSLPEVIGIEEATFDPYSTDAIKNKIYQCLVSDSFIKKLKEHGNNQAKKFSWDETSKKAIFQFEKLLANNSQLLGHEEDFSTEFFASQLSKILSKDSKLNDIDLIEYAACSAYNLKPKLEKKQLLIDISELVVRDAKSGIQRVVRSVLAELLKSPMQEFIVRPVYAEDNKLGYKYANQFTQKFLNSLSIDCRHLDTLFFDAEDLPIDYYANDIFLGLDLKPILIWFQQKYFDSLHLNGVKVFFIVYDLLPVQLPHFFPSTANQIHQDWLRVISRFDGMLCISQSVAEDLREYFKFNRINLKRDTFIDYFHLGSDIENSVMSIGTPNYSDDLLKQITKNISFLMVGTLEPRKGHLETIDAFDILWSKGESINLVIVGKEGWLVEKLVKRIESHPRLNSNLFWLNNISDEFLEVIYNRCECLIIASEGEGFGLPIIEAAQKGLPIIARDIKVFREVAKSHAYFFNGDYAISLTHAIEDWVTLFKKNQHPKSSEISFLNWEQSTKELVKLIVKNER
jgi:glycosyltransferase involved in cell wall biosynthesis